MIQKSFEFTTSMSKISKHPCKYRRFRVGMFLFEVFFDAQAQRGVSDKALVDGVGGVVQSLETMDRYPQVKVGT
jgi:hypothetical protein